MRNVALYAYNPASEGAKELAEALDIRRIKHEGSKFRGDKSKTVINWGASELPKIIGDSVVLNHPAFVIAMSNKLKFFQLMQGGPRLPDWTDNAGTAMEWFTKEKSPVVCRTLLNSHSGKGIVIWENWDVDFPKAPLYTRYVPKAAEYRVHFVGTKIVDVQRKIRRPDSEVKDWRVRNHDNGFIYVRGGVTESLPSDVLEQATKCIDRSGLDFGAVDVIWNDKRGAAYVLEINTAPGLSGETITTYAEALKSYIESQRKQ